MFRLFFVFLVITILFLPFGFIEKNIGYSSALTQEAYAETKKTSAKKPSVKKKSDAKKKASKAKTIKIKTRKKQIRQSTRSVTPPAPADYAEIVVDANNGTILFEKNAEQTRHPASLTKMMTLYILFEALENNKIRMSTNLPVSSKAAGQPPTNIFLDEGDEVPVKTAIEALVIRSANDVAMVVAEGLGGSQDNFAKMMNKKARELGMSKTKFFNPSGLPDDRQITTAMDMAKLGIALKRDFPEYYHYFSQDSFYFAGRNYNTHNRLLGRYPGADGIKTGYIRASGYNLVTSVERGRTRLVAVVLGGRTGASRDQEMMDILDNVFITLAQNTSGRNINGKAPVNKKPAEAVIEEKSEPLKPAAEQPKAFTPTELWGIQVGAYLDENQAQSAINSAEEIAKHELFNSNMEISTVERSGQIYFRARLLNLSNQEARDACQKLSIQNHSCMVVRVGD